MLLIPVGTLYLHYLAQCQRETYLMLSPGRAALVQLGILTLIFAGSYILNQIFDVESDRINDKLYFLPRKIIPMPLAWIIYIILSAAGILMAALMQSYILPAVIMIVLLGVFYSVPTIRLKDRPLAGLAANAAAYGLLIPWVAAWNCPERAVHTFAIPYFFAIAAGYVLTTIPDRVGDSATGKRTVAVIFGAKGAVWLALAFAVLSAGMSTWTDNLELTVTTAITSGLCIYLIFSYSRKTVIFACKFPILLLTIFASIHYPLYAAILLLTYFLTRAYYKIRFGIIYPRLD